MGLTHGQRIGKATGPSILGGVWENCEILKLWRCVFLHCAAQRPRTVGSVG